MEELKAESDGICETPVLKVKGSAKKPLTVILEIDGVQVPMELTLEQQCPWVPMTCMLWVGMALHCLAVIGYSFSS